MLPADGPNCLSEVLRPACGTAALHRACEHPKGESIAATRKQIKALHLGQNADHPSRMFVVVTIVTTGHRATSDGNIMLDFVRSKKNKLNGNLFNVL